MMPPAPNLAEQKRNVLDQIGWFVHVSCASSQTDILEAGLDPAKSEHICAITAAHLICYAPLSRLGSILVEIGGKNDEKELFVVVIGAASFQEAHALPDTTHEELAHAHDTPDALQHSIEDHGRMAYTRVVPPADFADSFVVRNLYNLLLPNDE